MPEYSAGSPLGSDIGTAEIANNAVTGAKIAMGSDAAGDVLYYNGTDYVRLGIGSATEVLTVNSGATAPEWAASGVTEAAEANTTPITTTADGNLASERRYVKFTLPTTEKFYIITGIEWENHSTLGGNMNCGVSRIDADPPTLAGTTLVALGDPIAQAGASSVQRNSNISSQMIKGGTVLGAWIANSGSTGRCMYGTVSSENNLKTKTYAVDEPTAESTAWTASTLEFYIKVYYVGFG